MGFKHFNKMHRYLGIAMQNIFKTRTSFVLMIFIVLPTLAFSPGFWLQEFLLAYYNQISNSVRVLYVATPAQAVTQSASLCRSACFLRPFFYFLPYNNMILSFPD